MAKFAVILPAAGKSTRLAMKNRKKVFLDLKGRAVWLRAAEHFTNRDDVIQTVIVISPEDMEFFKEKYAPNLAFMNIQIVAGGADRSESVRNGLAQIRPDVDFVAVHDAARPLLCKEWIDRVFKTAEQTGAAMAGIRVTSTLKRVDSNGCIEATVPRDNLWEAQTPQVFRRQLLLDAYAKQGHLKPTDEAQLIEQYGHPISMVECSSINMKITTAEDLRLAEAALEAVPKPNVLRPLHPFADEEAK
ncbi:MAG: 2-C-methyl-D-erythritol 4-phosphate cytidylyltransferase [Planctomycetaceae bacterium]|nr:2-C-methyl-D-erythritol 4-phosphate cytidylyltransferase [Planctomycetaceae bacterium]